MHVSLALSIVPASFFHPPSRAISRMSSVVKISEVARPIGSRRNSWSYQRRYRQAASLHGTLRSGTGYVRPRIVPHDDDLRQAAEVLNAGTKVAMLVGAGALGAVDEVTAVADKLGAGVAKALLGKAALPDDLPWVTGSIGLLGTKPSGHCR
jgi:pyruvate dehydrogenase (quinone)